MKAIPAIGNLVRVEWDDICAYTNEELTAAKPARCTTFGIVQKRTRDHIVLATSLFKPDNPTDTPQGDFVAIPCGCIRAVSIV